MSSQEDDLLLHPLTLPKIMNFVKDLDLTEEKFFPNNHFPIVKKTTGFSVNEQGILECAVFSTSFCCFSIPPSSSCHLFSIPKLSTTFS